MEDIISMLNADAPTTAPVVNQPPQYNNTGYNGGGQKEDLFNANIPPKAVDKSQLRRASNTFAVITASNVVPEDVLMRIYSAAKLLFEKGLVFRFSGEKENQLGMTIYSSNVVNTDIMLPYKKFNADITDAKTYKPTKLAREYASGYHTKYNELSPGARTHLGNNMHIILGENTNAPLTVLLTYSPKGEESDKGMDYATVGKTSFFLRAASDLNIPVFNFANPDALDRLRSFI